MSTSIRPNSNNECLVFDDRRYVHEMKLMSTMKTMKTMKTMMITLIVLLCVIISQSVPIVTATVMRTPEVEPIDVSVEALKLIASMYTPSRLSKHLDKLLNVRIPDTPAHAEVAAYIESHFNSSLGSPWDVQYDRFQNSTPIGNVSFSNIIATYHRNREPTLIPDGRKRLVLACHYDSLTLPNGEEFTGAIDSAVPCAMLLEIAEIVNDMFTYVNYTDTFINGNTELQLIFFDGEEAFVQWNETDSLYGSRHLSNQWLIDGSIHNIDVMLLLDLIGYKLPEFYTSLFRTTDSLHQRLEYLEEDMRSSNLLYVTNHTYFKSIRIPGIIQDDHTPFIEKGVPVVHMIAFPFPDVWHTPADNATIIDYQSVHDISIITTAFVCEYLGLSP